VLSTVFFTVMFLADPSWVLQSQITRQLCAEGTCQPLAGLRVPQTRVVQTFATADECLRMRETMMQQSEDAITPLRTAVQARHPARYMRMTMTFLCTPAEGITAQELWR
jgi:hypothetical protein